jgi:hypothetical protein
MTTVWIRIGRTTVGCTCPGTRHESTKSLLSAWRRVNSPNSQQRRSLCREGFETTPAACPAHGCRIQEAIDMPLVFPARDDCHDDTLRTSGVPGSTGAGSGAGNHPGLRKPGHPAWHALCLRDVDGHCPQGSGGRVSRAVAQATYRYNARATSAICRTSRRMRSERIDIDVLCSAMLRMR